MTSQIPTLQLNDGHPIPAIGFGTWPLKGVQGRDTVHTALTNGYRLIDSATNYENEGVVGRGIQNFLAESGVSRDEVTVQSKLAGRHHDYDSALAAGYESVTRLGLERLDVLLIHWPNPITNKYREAWRGLVELQKRGLVRSIGVSNFTDEHLANIIEDSGVTPAINQIELHPYFTQAPMRDVHQKLGIVTEAWSPLGKRKAPFTEAPVADAAAAHGVTPAQVILRWHVQLGTLPLPKSSTPSRQVANLDVFGFQLSDSEVAAISGLGKADGRLSDGHPDTHEEM